MRVIYRARLRRRGYVLEFALRSVSAEHSDSPMYFVLPALRIASRAGMDCSSGVSGWSLLALRSSEEVRIHTWIDTV